MDYAMPVLSYEAPHLPVSEGGIDYHIGADHRAVLGQPSAMRCPRKNKLLAALPDEDYKRLVSDMELIQLASGSTLHEAGGELKFAYFPIAGIVSPLCVMGNGATLAVGITGNEGMVGTSLFMGRRAMPIQAVVQSAGQAYRLGARRLRQEFDRGGFLCQLLLGYTQSLLTQMALTAVCNRYHSIEQQLCRWLLLSLDRVSTNELILTHEGLSNLLGVRRESITEAAGKLQKARVIRYGRGHITILNRLELKKRVCECYAV